MVPEGSLPASGPPQRGGEPLNSISQVVLGSSCQALQSPTLKNKEEGKGHCQGLQLPAGTPVPRGTWAMEEQGRVSRFGVNTPVPGVSPSQRCLFLLDRSGGATQLNR